MADKEDGEETARRGNEWEVVSLTASAYAAAPGLEEVNSSMDNSAGENEAETSNAMFMSGHFVFPPSQHENLPLEPEHSETQNEKVGGYDLSSLVTEKVDKSFVKDEGNLSIEGLMSHEFPGIQIFDEKGNRISTSDVDYGKDLILEKDERTLSTTELHSFRRGATTDESYIIQEGEGNHDTITPQDHESDSGSQNPVEGGKNDGDDLPCEAWWKRRALSLYVHAKEANSFWSVFIAAAVMGLVIIGHQWQQERWKLLHLKWQFGVSDEVLTPTAKMIILKLLTGYD